MDPQTLKEWADAITAPSILIVLGFALWRASAYAGGIIGPKLERFLESTSGAIQEMPRAVETLNKNFLELGGETIRRLDDLQQMHKSPNSEFSTRRTNMMLVDVMRVKKLLADVLEKIARDRELDVGGELAQMRKIMDYWLLHQHDADGEGQRASGRFSGEE